MDDFIKNEFKLVECYRASAGAEEATENCQKYADAMKSFVNQDGLEYKNVMKDLWRVYYKTREYYAPKNINSQH
jgi:hypothetical protein